ncbi:hypothetical protein A0U95_17305 [Pseudomonas brassicacearum]|nr:hypothetical protein A0U95_17305 [Pseudomonas brassicacearum]
MLNRLLYRTLLVNACFASTSLPSGRDFLWRTGFLDFRIQSNAHMVKRVDGGLFIGDAKIIARR